MIERETFWIKEFNSAKAGYNVHESGIGPRGIKRRLETIAKMKISFKGRKYPSEVAARMGIKKGSKWSEKQREVYANRPKGPLSEEERLRRYATRRRPKSKEHAEKLAVHCRNMVKTRRAKKEKE